MDNQISRDQVIQAHRNAPEIVRAVFGDEKTTELIINLKDRFGLRVDSAGLLGKGVGYMLLGLMTPQALQQQLVSSGVQESVTQQILSEINQKIFVPLREQMRNAGGAPSTQPKPMPPSSPRSTLPPGVGAQRPANMQAPRYYAPPPQSPKYFHLDNKLPTSEAPSAAPPRPATPGVAPLPPKNILPHPSAPAAPAAPRPMNKMLSDHEEAHIEVANPAPTPPAPPIPSSPPPPAPSAKPELREALRTVLPPSNGNPGGAKPPPNLPGAMPPSDLMPPTPKPPPTPYPVDPYREPI